MEAPLDILIRRAKAEDIANILPLVQKICDMHRAMDPERYPFVSDVVEQYRSWMLKRCQDPDSVLLVACAGEAIAGFVVGEILDEIPVFTLKRYGFLHDLWVEPEYRRRGIANRLLRMAIETLSSRGITQIRGDTAIKNPDARAMLEKLKFVASTILMVRKSGPES